MFSLSSFGRFLERRSRLRGYEAMRSEIQAISDEDLADIGIKRYQLGHVARVKALK